MTDDVIRLFKEAPVLMVATCLLAAGIGAGIAVWQNQPKLNALNEKIAALRAEMKVKQ